MIKAIIILLLLGIIIFSFGTVAHASIGATPQIPDFKKSNIQINKLSTYPQFYSTSTPIAPTATYGRIKARLGF